MYRQIGTCCSSIGIGADTSEEDRKVWWLGTSIFAALAIASVLLDKGTARVVAMRRAEGRAWMLSEPRG
jgi:hypothetical protein